MNDGDWICSDPNCGNINFSRRVSCYRCNKERPNGAKPSKRKLGTEIGKSAAEKSRGLFNADDWQCNKCANVNWARRPTCNVCNAPKFGEVEARTGYGGGYNERGVVEYRKREPSSDDEYDEFGRKKRKRKAETADTADTVGITEGPVIKSLPPTKQIVEPILPVPPVIIAQKNKKVNELKNGSLSDGSVCDMSIGPRLSYHKNVQSYSYSKQNITHPIPKYKGFQRKHYSSISDKDQSGSSGHEGNAIMENRVTSTNNDIVYKFTGPTPSEAFEVSYTIEERVIAAAFAIVYKNCRISTSKFESKFDKPAPDFKTIFGWRQRLLNTGCLIDNHIEKGKELIERPTYDYTSQENKKQKTVPYKLPNPDEISISSESEDEQPHYFQPNNKALPSLLKRSVSAETLLIDNMDMGRNNTAPGSVSTVDGREATRSQSSSTHNRTRSSSRDSQDSNYPESDVEIPEPKDSNTRHTPATLKISKHTAISQSDSDSFSYNSEDVDFRSRVFGETKKVKRRLKRNMTYKNNTYVPDTNQTFQGYTTQKQVEKSPLATGNIYMPNFHNMNIRTSGHNLVDADGLSSEYVPTMMAATAKKHYQDFKNNVKKKGFWAKGNGSFVKNTPSVMSTLNSSAIDTDYRTLQQNNDMNKNDDFTKDVFDNITNDDNYVFFGEPLGSTPNIQKAMTNNSRVFDVVQSDSINKNKNIMDIFSNDDAREKSPELVSDLDRYDSVRKMYENSWNDDDDDLYKDSDTTESNTKDTNPPSNLELKPNQSPTSNMLYNESENEIINDKGVNKEKVEKHCEQLLGLLKDLQGNDDIPCRKTSETIHNQFDKEKLGNHLEPSLLDIPLPDTISTQMSNELRKNPNESPECVPRNRNKIISPSKRVHILESVTIKPKDSDFPVISKRNTEEQNTNQALEIRNDDVENRKTLQDNDKIDRLQDFTQKVPQIDLSNILSNINTDTLFLALQNLQQMSQPQTNAATSIVENNSSEDENNIEQEANLETINLTNDDWELESIRHDSIERELRRLDGNSGETPFLSDIFDPGPVTMPLNIAIKFNNSIKNPDDKGKSQIPHLNENAPVIGNFKSFALPKPVILNRLKLTVKQPDKNKKSAEGNQTKRKKKPTTSASQEGQEVEDDDEEESGDEADLSKYDLWGSDDEKNNTSKAENDDGENKNENSKHPVEPVNNRKSPVERRRSRSSSTSSSSSSSSSSSHSSTNTETPKNKFDDFNLNSERESPHESPKGRKSSARSRSPRSPRSRSSSAPARRRSRDSRSAGETRTSRDKEWSRDRERRDRSRGSREKKERRYSREGSGNHYGGRGRHR